MHLTQNQERFWEIFVLLEHSALRKILSKKQQQDWSQSTLTQPVVCEQRTGALCATEEEFQHLGRPKTVRDRDKIWSAFHVHDGWNQN